MSLRKGQQRLYPEGPARRGTIHMHICSDTQAGPCPEDHLRMRSSMAPSPLTLSNPDYALQAPPNASMPPIARDMDEVPSREAASQVRAGARTEGPAFPGQQRPRPQDGNQRSQGRSQG